jgi:hypothetical protein
MGFGGTHKILTVTQNIREIVKKRSKYLYKYVRQKKWGELVLSDKTIISYGRYNDLSL